MFVRKLNIEIASKNNIKIIEFEVKKMRINIVLAVLLLFLCGSAISQPTPPATPPSPESMGIQAPQPTLSTQAPPPVESSQALVSTTKASASAAAPSTMAAQMTMTTSAYMIVPPGTSAPNLFYIPYYPSTIASCYFGQWVPMWLDVKGYGPLYSYEWYPNGKLASQYMANIPFPSWQKMWFYGDAPGWHTLQYYCNGWSNYIYVYVYGGISPPPTTSCKAQVVVSSPYSVGFYVYVDGNYVGGDGQGGDPLDGYYAFNVQGNQQHTIKVVSYQGGIYTQTKTYYCGNTYPITISYSGSMPPTQPPSPPDYVYPGTPYGGGWVPDGGDDFVEPLGPGSMRASDVRLKINITPIDIGLQEILQLNPVTFNWKKDSNGTLHYGLVAQEVKNVIPDAVTRSAAVTDDIPDGQLNMNYEELIPILVKSIQELNAKVELLENESQKCEKKI
jgi:Chaperone of endosialidase